MEESKILIPLITFTLLFCVDISLGLNRCYACRSRGELGSCKDPFNFNSSQAELERGIEIRPCASGWCGKMIEAESDLKDEEYGVVHQRNCFQRGPSDSEDRCAYTKFKNRKVYMCFCKGDLCNVATNYTVNNCLLTLSFVIVTFYFLIKK